MNDIRICSIKTNGPIKELGNIQGPIKKCKLGDKQVISMVHNGHVIYELNPENLSESVLLDITNVMPSPFSKESVNVNPVVTEPEKSVFVKEERGETFEEEIPSPETTGVKEEDETETEDVMIVKPVDVRPNNQQMYSNKYDKKNKHNKHKNQNNNYQKPVVTTPEEKVVKSDF